MIAWLQTLDHVARVILGINACERTDTATPAGEGKRKRQLTGKHKQEESQS